MPINPESLPLPTTLDAQWQMATEARNAEQRGDYGTAFLALLALIIGKKIGNQSDEPRSPITDGTISRSYERSIRRYERSFERFTTRR